MQSGTLQRPLDTLLVEDNWADIRLMQEALREAAFDDHLHVTRDGVEALDFLRQRGAYHSAPRPDLIVLDLNLPRKDGREVLAEIKRDPSLKRIPVVVLTTSADGDDVAEAYDHHVNCYVTKPVDLDRFVEVIKAIRGFWTQVATLPQM